MIKSNLWKIIVSSLFVLCPIIFGVIFWDSLPEVIGAHFGASGEADGFVGRAFAVFGIPCILLAIHLVCLVVTLLDPKNREQDRKALGIVYFIVPLVSVFSNGMIYAIALGMELDALMIANLLVGILLIVIGNFLPKCKRNSTLGIKIPWTLASDENWNATHRVGGWAFFVSGILSLAAAFLPGVFKMIAMLVIILLSVVTLFVYSFCYYKKHEC